MVGRLRGGSVGEGGCERGEGKNAEEKRGFY